MRSMPVSTPDDATSRVLCLVACRRLIPVWSRELSLRVAVRGDVRLHHTFCCALENLRLDQRVLFVDKRLCFPEFRILHEPLLQFLQLRHYATCLVRSLETDSCSASQR